MKYELLVHVIHVAGTQMIAQRTDGCYRVSLLVGGMAEHDMLSVVDLAQTAIERHPPLLDWIREWTGQPTLEPLTPEGWFEECHGIIGGDDDRNGVSIPDHGPANKMFLWAPQPATADAALEELLKARHKRTDTFHIVVVPRLMAHRGRCLFNKVCDFSFVVSPECSFWPSHMYKPLWVCVDLPFIHHRPWYLKQAPRMAELGISLRGMLPSCEANTGDLLRRLLLFPKRLARVSERMARGVLHLPGEGSIPNVDNSG